ncbi:diguanylate cyclase [Niveibacterium sp. SC-1]|uniref:GGDEF domain-containing protein n=1 Tax=Niveibacterium sp. SC-1 TaxID=3135646 RepID=UPI00311E3521
MPWFTLPLFLLLALFCGPVGATAIDFGGDWYKAAPGWQYTGQGDVSALGLSPVPAVRQDGGQYWYQADFHVARDGDYVLDFRGSSIIGNFRHVVLDAQGKPLAELWGGILNRAENPFFIRHGRRLHLEAGRYRLLTQVEAPFFLGSPEPYLEDEAIYRQATKAGDALTLCGLGIFIGLGIYYASLAVTRRRRADAMYALFILGNLLFNANSLLVLPDVFGLHWYYLSSMPILFSNMAYVVFVGALLEVRRGSNPRLLLLGRTCFGLLFLFAVAGVTVPRLSMSLAHAGVLVFMLWGLSAGVTRTVQGNVTARFYLIANLAFFIPAVAAISLQSAGKALTVEHFGLFAVAVEVILLGLVLSYQFGQLQRERMQALAFADQSLKVARTDALTGLPNRYALEVEIAMLPEDGSLTFVDLDGLKLYNDRFGHTRGDALLCDFASEVRNRLGRRAALHRLGGDEFAITCPRGDEDFVSEQIEASIVALHGRGFELAGASHGTVHMRENPGREQVKHMADLRMYERKRQRREQQQPPAPPPP